MLAPILVATVASVHVRAFCQRFPPPSHAGRRHFHTVLCTAAPLLAAAAAAGAAVATATLQDPAWGDGTAASHAAVAAFSARNTGAAAAAAATVVAVACTVAQVAFASRGVPAAPVRGALRILRHLSPFVHAGILDGLAPAFVAWLTVGDILVVARSHALHLFTASAASLAAGTPAVGPPAAAWVASALCFCFITQLAVFGLPLILVALRVLGELAVAGATAAAAQLLDPPRRATSDAARVAVDLSGNRLGDASTIRLLATATAALPPHRRLTLAVSRKHLTLGAASRRRGGRGIVHIYRTRGAQWQLADGGRGGGGLPLQLLPVWKDGAEEAEGDLLVQLLQGIRLLVADAPRSGLHKYLLCLP